MKNKKSSENKLRNELIETEWALESEREFPDTYLLNSITQVICHVQHCMDDNIKHKLAEDLLSLVNRYREEE